MERAISRQPTRKVCKVPALTKMPLATLKEDARPTQTQLASKPAKKEDTENNNRPKLVPLHNRVNQRMHVPSKIPTKMPSGLLQTKTSEHSREAVTDRGQENFVNTQLQHNGEVAGDLNKGTAADKGTDTTNRRSHRRDTRTAHLLASSEGKQPDNRAVACRIAPTEHLPKHQYFHSLQPDHVTDINTLPELVSLKELHDPQQCTEYIRDIYENLLTAERDLVYRTMPIMLNQQSEVKENHRRVLVDWLIQVHQKFNLLPDTLHICIDILDRYLQVVNVPKKELQLVGVTAMFISSKYEEIYPSSIAEFVYIAADTYTVKQICQKEVDILRLLNYQLGKPYPLIFLRRYSKLMSTTTQAHNLAKYFIEISYLSTDCRMLLPSQLAIGALVLAARVTTKRDVALIWSEIMENYTWYTRARAAVFAEEVLQQILQYYQVLNKNSRYPSIAEKYSGIGFQSVATYPRLSTKLESFAMESRKRRQADKDTLVQNTMSCDCVI